MIINNNFQKFNFNGFKDFVYDTELSENENLFAYDLKISLEKQIDKRNGKNTFLSTDKFIPAEELKNYDIIDVYGDIYRDENNKNEVFLKLRIKPTPDAIEIIKKGAFDEQAKAELNKNSLITEFVSQPMAIRSKSTFPLVIRNLEEKLAFFKRYLSGTVKWKTSTKDLLKSSDKPKFGWDRDLYGDYNREQFNNITGDAIKTMRRLKKIGH